MAIRFSIFLGKKKSNNHLIFLFPWEEENWVATQFSPSQGKVSP
jgi:hypothetical protein